MGRDERTSAEEPISAKAGNRSTSPRTKIERLVKKAIIRHLIADAIESR